MRSITTHKSRYLILSQNKVQYVDLVTPTNLELTTPLYNEYHDIYNIKRI